MSANSVSGFGKKVRGYTKEIVAEITGDAPLQEDGRREIAEGRGQGSSPATDPRHNDTPEEPRR